jgi:hypothetical protein
MSSILRVTLTLEPVSDGLERAGPYGEGFCMKKIFGAAAAALMLVACGDATGDRQQSNSDQGGGSMTGAGGAGPGYDGSGSGSGKYGTTPESSAGTPVEGNYRNLQTNQPGTNTQSAEQRPAPPTPPSPQ